MRILEDGERRRVERRRARRQARAWAACSSRTATWASRTARRWRSSPSASPPRPSGARCCSPGRSASTCAPTRSCSSNDLASVGIGAGQMSRVDSVRLAIEKARAGRLLAARRRAGLRRLLPVRRRPAARDRRGRHGDHPAGRLDARPRGRRGRRRRRHQHGLHAPPPLQALDRHAAIAVPQRASRLSCVPSCRTSTACASTSVGTVARHDGSNARPAARLRPDRDRRGAGPRSDAGRAALDRRGRRARPARAWSALGFGARDVAVGAGALVRARTPAAPVRPVAARRGAVADVVDLAATFAARRALPAPRRARRRARSAATRRRARRSGPRPSADAVEHARPDRRQRRRRRSRAACRLDGPSERFR